MQSFAQTYDRAMGLASVLEDLDLAPGGRVGILATNGPWFAELYFAACETGIVEVPINLRFTLSELHEYLGRVAPEVILVTAEQASMARDIQSLVPTVRHLVGVGEGHGLALDYDTLLSRAKAYERPLRDPSELVLISPTSGTSGIAKAVAHPQTSTAWGFAPLIDRFEVGEDSHIITGLAMYFATAYSGWLMSFVAGATHTMMPSYDPAGYVELVEAFSGTHAFLGPTPVYMIMDAGIDLRRLSGLRYLSMGGAPVDATRLEAMTDVLGNRIAIQFGMTELAAGTSLVGDELVGADGRLLPTHKSIGRPLGDLDARVIDDAGAVLATDDDAAMGELELRGAAVCAGYLDDDAANQTAFHDGWFRTGDAARIDELGNIYILDRKKDLIVSGGINIAPLEVEGAIAAHPAVLAVGVCGVPDDTYGEAVHAAVVVKPGASVSESEVIAWCRDRLASVKKPRSVTFVDALPISSTGKLLRRDLRAQAEQLRSEG
jgi:acyl-CoA synthetase (AMP-forming)/AMP-acid ligase II